MRDDIPAAPTVAAAAPTPPRRGGSLTASLAADKLGIPAVVFFVVSAATPLTAVAGVITLGYAVTGLIGLPLAFLLIGALLILFCVGYVAMSRYIHNAGSFYAYIAQGLGRPAGVGAAWVALLSYNMLQVGLYGVIGAAASPLLEVWAGWSLPWWLIAGAAWLIVAVLGLQQVDLNGKVLAVLLGAEIAVLVVFSVFNVGNPAGGTILFDTFEPDNLFGPGVGALLALAVLGFIGVEAATVFSEETRDPRRTVPIALYVSIAIMACLYAFAGWGMSVAVGPDQIVAASGEQEIDLLFNLAGEHLAPVFADIGYALFLTSLLAALIAFHNISARYAFALGRERVLPAVFGRTSARSGSPKVASMVQSLIGIAVITTYAVAGWDPLVQLFFWAGTSGGLGVLLLISTTALSVVVFFARRPAVETWWRRSAAPAVSTVLLFAVVWLALDHFDVLLGVDDSHPLRWGVPAGFAVLALLGAGWGLTLRATKPEVYRGVGRGAHASAVDRQGR